MHRRQIDRVPPSERILHKLQDVTSRCTVEHKHMQTPSEALLAHKAPEWLHSSPEILGSSALAPASVHNGRFQAMKVALHGNLKATKPCSLAHGRDLLRTCSTYTHHLTLDTDTVPFDLERVSRLVRL